MTFKNETPVMTPDLTFATTQGFIDSFYETSFPYKNLMILRKFKDNEWAYFFEQHRQNNTLGAMHQALLSCQQHSFGTSLIAILNYNLQPFKDSTWLVATQLPKFIAEQIILTTLAIASLALFAALLVPTVFFAVVGLELFAAMSLLAALIPLTFAAKFIGYEVFHAAIHLLSFSLILLAAPLKAIDNYLQYSTNNSTYDDVIDRIESELACDNAPYKAQSETTPPSFFGKAINFFAGVPVRHQQNTSPEYQYGYAKN